MLRVIWLLKTLLVFQLFHFSSSINAITPNNSIKDGDVIDSAGKIFTLGFFSPGKSTKRYVGIWYYQDPDKAIVWVANRNEPINDTSGVLSINNGNLVLSERNQTVLVWSTNVSVTSTSNTVAQLLDTGNLVLVENETNKTLWEGFDHLTNTLIPFMKLGLDRQRGVNWSLTSWKSPDDPGTGNYSYWIDPTGFPQLSLYMGLVKIWRTGSWTGQRLIGIPEMQWSNTAFSTFEDNGDKLYSMYGITNPSVRIRLVLNESGVTQRFSWNKRWIQFASAPIEQCDYYGNCGTNSNCNPYDDGKVDFECTCLPGYEPVNPQSWLYRDGTDGCRRKQGMSTCQKGEGFVKVPRLKVPDTNVTHVDLSLGLKECERKCLSDCSCLAYTSAYAESEGGANGCLTYHGDMIDARTYTNTGQDFYVRVNATELANGSLLGKKTIVAIVTISLVTLLLAITLMCLFIQRKRKEKAKYRTSSFNVAASSTYLDDSFDIQEQGGNTRNSDLPMFDLRTIAAATDNFSAANKLGEGGFGHVYKGHVHNGKEIAVKRLSKYSGQGIEEFKNEISLIAKLQHRNLVRILGCCIEEEEKMLIYEYLPNKSLDCFIFDETQSSLLDWGKRLDIIWGIARGILYLHQDSRLRIIHRDLKTSNVLLDATMNPKISDFGMARIFGGDQIEANTNRVVGTYGYMSPEYAMQGLISVKSDVYSFGVLLLEIITGRKNSTFFVEDFASSYLVGHVWDLWNEGKTIDIVDKALGESYPADEVLRCIQIGLLCVQEQATDRPTMFTVVFMLGNGNALPSPERPAFIGKKISAAGSSTSEGVGSVNEMTISMFQGR